MLILSGMQLLMGGRVMTKIGLHLFTGPALQGPNHCGLDEILAIFVHWSCGKNGCQFADDIFIFIFRHRMMSSNGNIFHVTGHFCGEFTGPGEFPTQRPVTQSFDVFSDPRLNKRLSKQSWGWWFETYCAHYDVIVMNRKCCILIFIEICSKGSSWKYTTINLDMSWHCTGNKLFSKLKWPSFGMHICKSWPQCVKEILFNCTYDSRLYHVFYHIFNGIWCGHVHKVKINSVWKCMLKGLYGHQNKLQNGIWLNVSTIHFLLWHHSLQSDYFLHNDKQFNLCISTCLTGSICVQ